ncbi:MAG: alpha/beta hydrolase [Candidatus Absconditabacteria bacterium]
MILQKLNICANSGKFLILFILSSLMFLVGCGNTTQTNNSDATNNLTGNETVNSSSNQSNYMPANGENRPGMMNKSSVDTSGINTKYLDISYGSVSDSQKLDIYLPNEGNGPFPLIIEIHGGGFMFGDKSQQIGPMLKALEQGYAVASVNYRHSGEAVFPAAINDVKAAIRFLRANSGTYNLNPDAFATWGGSAGGNLSALAATSAGGPIGENDNLYNIDISDKVQAAIDWYGPVSFDTMDTEFTQLGITQLMGTTSAEGSAESKYLGEVVGSEKAKPLVDATNPATYIDSNDPAIFFQHGSVDANVPYLQSQNLSDALGKVIGSENATFELIQGAAHGGSEFETQENIDKIINFLNKYLK